MRIPKAQRNGLRPRLLGARPEEPKVEKAGEGRWSHYGQGGMKYLGCDCVPPGARAREWKRPGRKGAGS